MLDDRRTLFKTNGKGIAKKITVSNKQGTFWNSLLIIQISRKVLIVDSNQQH